MSNSFQLCPTHFPGGRKVLQGFSPPYRAFALTAKRDFLSWLTVALLKPGEHQKQHEIEKPCGWLYSFLSILHKRTDISIWFTVKWRFDATVCLCGIIVCLRSVPIAPCPFYGTCACRLTRIPLERRCQLVSLLIGNSNFKSPCSEQFPRHMKRYTLVWWKRRNVCCAIKSINWLTVSGNLIVFLPELVCVVWLNY